MKLLFLDFFRMLLHYSELPSRHFSNPYPVIVRHQVVIDKAGQITNDIWTAYR